MDLSQYLEIFIDETKEHLQTLNDQVLILEAEPENIDTVNEIFRAAHSLKGMAGTMGFKRMQRLTHDMENVFSEIRNGKLNVNADMVDIVFKCLDAIEGYLTNIIESADEGTEDNEELIGLLNDALEESTDAAPAEEKKKEPEAEKSSSEKKADGDRCKFRNVPIADGHFWSLWALRIRERLSNLIRVRRILRMRNLSWIFLCLLYQKSPLMK